MSDDDLKAILAKYQQKSFELYNSNIVLETQIDQLNSTILSLKKEIERLSTRQKRKQEEDFS